MINFFDLCEGNPGSLTFIMSAYSYNPFKAESGFARMRDNNITGSKLYMLWNDCCNKNTERAIDIMIKESIDDIVMHINYEGGRGIDWSDEE